jgi:4-carboxymuconolactone decarboxylase
MRLSQPRIEATQPESWTEEQRRVLARMIDSGRPVLNIFKTLARKPKAYERFMSWASYILSDRSNSVAPREREIAILRVGWNCRSGYEWAQHVPIGKRAGLTDAEIEGLKRPVEEGSWHPADAALIRATDDLTRDFFVSEASWAALSEHWSEEQCMDLVFTVGQYTQVSMILNSFGVQLDEGQTLDPDFAR